MIYDYECNKCLIIHEEYHGMLEKPVIYCNKCGGQCSKLICGNPSFCGVDGTAGMYSFVDYNTTGKPVVINSKTQWKNHIKKYGLIDDIKNDPLTKSDIENIQRKELRKKEDNRKEIKKKVIEVYKTKNSPQFKQRVQKVLREGG